MSATQFRDLLEQGDVGGLMRYWREARPDFPQPASRQEAEVMMHRARTEAIMVGFRARAYSHRWLTERNMPSGLPDELRPKAERIYPVVKEAVGLVVGYSVGWMKPAAEIVRGAMEDAVMDCYADNRTDPGFVKSRILEVKGREERRLFGNFELALKAQ